MLLVIDNFDSFTYNLVQYIGQLGVETQVFRNNAITVDEALELKPDWVLISPGPCTPNEAGVSLAMVAACAGKIPLLGVCLGHQSIGQHFGGKVIRAKNLMHGKTSKIQHKNSDLFKDIPQDFLATRYHSRIVERETLPKCLEITAETAEGEIMGMRHKELPVYGVQFHPESFATEHGLKLIQNFIELTSCSALNALT